MRVALIGVEDPLGGRLRARLGARHELLVVPDATNPEACAAAASSELVVHGYPVSGAAAGVEQATRGVWNALTTTRASRVVQLSSMRMFDDYPEGWAIDESWVPRPSPDPVSLAVYLGELTAREICRTRDLECVALRLDRVVDAETYEAGPVGPDWLHVDDAVGAIAAAVEAETLPSRRGRWRSIHVVRGDGRYPLPTTTMDLLSFRPVHTVPASGSSVREPRRPTRPEALEDLPDVGPVSILGAGGPLGAVTARELSHRHRLLLTDRRPLRECPQQSPGAPVPDRVDAPNTERVIDITDPDQVTEAAANADCLINCAVNRDHVDLAFRVNVLGTLNVMRAAVACGIQRVVFTGPALTLETHPVGYNEDPDITASTPPRPGGSLYHLTKFLAQEISRIYSEHYAIACPALLFCGFVSPGIDMGYQPHPFSVTWADAGRAMAAAVEVRRLPAPFSVVHIHADSPHGRYRNEAGRAVLGWEPQDRLDQYWMRT